MFLTHTTTTLGLFFQGFGMWEAIILTLVGVLIFGKRLPEVGKSIGRSIVEFKKGLAGIEDDITTVKEPSRIEQHSSATAHVADTSETTESRNTSS